MNPDPTLRPNIEKVMASEWISTAPTVLDEELEDEIKKVLNL